MINWTEFLSGLDLGWRIRKLKQFAHGAITRDMMINSFPMLREVIRAKGVNSVRNAARKALSRRGL